VRKIWVCGVLVWCALIGYGAESDEELLQSFAPRSEPMRYLEPDKTDKQPLEYANLFSKPDIEWKDIAKAKSGLFIGVGANLIPVVRTGSTTPVMYNDIYPISGGFDVKLGYMYFSNPFVGFRVYGEYARSYANEVYGSGGFARTYEIEMYNAGVSIVLDTNLGQKYDHMLSVIVDLAYVPHIGFVSEWTHSAAGMHTYGEDRFIGGNKVALGLGFGYVFKSKHRFELMFKRLTDVREGKDTLLSTNASPIVFQQILSMTFGYIYVF